MVGDGRTGHIQQGRNVNNTLLCVAQKPENAYPCGIAKLLENICYGFKPAYLKQCCL